jgi:hypothetical protein
MKHRKLAAKAIDIAESSQKESGRYTEYDAISADVELIQAHFPGMDSECKARAEQTIKDLFAGERRYNDEWAPANHEEIPVAEAA